MEAQLFQETWGSIFTNQPVRNTFIAHGILKFGPNNTAPLIPDVLATITIGAERANPWLSYHSQARGIDITRWLRVHPVGIDIEFLANEVYIEESRHHAFIKFVDTLAGTVAGLGIPGVGSVSSAVRFEKLCRTHYTPISLKQLYEQYPTLDHSPA